MITYKLIYLLNALVFMCLGGFFSLKWFILRKRKTEPFLIAVFTALSLSYVLHALTYIFQSQPAFFGILWIDFVVALTGVFFLSIMMGKEGIFPFNIVYVTCTKIVILYDKYKFKRNLKKATKDIV